MPSQKLIEEKLAIFNKGFERAVAVPTDKQIQEKIQHQVFGMCHQYISEYFGTQSQSILLTIY